MKIDRYVFDHREGLRWFFTNTETWKCDRMISLDIRDIKLLKYGIKLFWFPTKVEHIKWIKID